MLMLLQEMNGRVLGMICKLRDGLLDFIKYEEIDYGKISSILFKS